MNLRRSLLCRSAGCWAASGLLFIAATPGAAADRVQYADGERIEIQGAVRDAEGAPLPGRTVLFEAYRRASGMGSLNPRSRGKKKGLAQRTAVTEADGRYAIEWTWQDYFDRFELSVGEFGPDGFEAVERIDISQRILQGPPIIVSFLLGRTGASTAPPATAQPSTGQPYSGQPSTGQPPRPSSAGSPRDDAARSDARPGAGGDRDRVRNREGEPDLVDTLELPYGREVTWWYFGRGRAYRFLDGELSDELSFDPVRSEGQSSASQSGGA